MKKGIFLLVSLLLLTIFLTGCQSENQITTPIAQKSTTVKMMAKEAIAVDYQLYDGTVWGVDLPIPGVEPVFIGDTPSGREFKYQDLTIYTPARFIGYKDDGTNFVHVGAYVATDGQVKFVLPKPATSVSILAYDDIYGWWQNGTILKAFSNSGEQIGTASTAASGYTEISVTAPAGKTIDYITLSLKYVSDKWEQVYIHFAHLKVTYLSEIKVNFDITPQVINIKKKGVTPTVIYSTVDFDATTIDLTTLSINGLSVKEAHAQRHKEDVNMDGLIDLTLHFDTQSMGLVPGNFEAVLKGKTLNGDKFSGSDKVLVK